MVVLQALVRLCSFRRGSIFHKMALMVATSSIFVILTYREVFWERTALWDKRVLSDIVYSGARILNQESTAEMNKHVDDLLRNQLGNYSIFKRVVEENKSSVILKHAQFNDKNRTLINFREEYHQPNSDASSQDVHYTIVRHSDIVRIKNGSRSLRRTTFPPWQYDSTKDTASEPLHAERQANSGLNASYRHAYRRSRSGLHLAPEVMEDTNPSYNVTDPTKLCPAYPPNIGGLISVDWSAPSFSELTESQGELDAGGVWRPRDCTARHRVAIIVPYRDRQDHLRTFLHNIHPYLQKQQIHYGIYIVEQAGEEKFNRGMLFNIGFREASKLHTWDCFIFHDVDLVPEDDRNLYSCPARPRHMSAAVDTLLYRLPYFELFGGVSAMTRDQFEKVNGFSNCYFGWGAEDDDMSWRISSSGLEIKRYPLAIARYKMMRHEPAEQDDRRLTTLNQKHVRHRKDGLNSLRYKLLDVNKTPLFTKILVHINKTEVLSAFPDLVALLQVHGPPLEVPAELDELSERSRGWIAERVLEEIDVRQIEQLGLALDGVNPDTRPDTRGIKRKIRKPRKIRRHLE